MAFEESQCWYTLVTEVCVAFYTVLDKIADATIKKRKLYRIYRSGARLGFSSVGRFSQALLRSDYDCWSLEVPKCAAAVDLRTPEPLRVEEE